MCCLNSDVILIQMGYEILTIWYCLQETLANIQLQSDTVKKTDVERSEDDTSH